MLTPDWTYFPQLAIFLATVVFLNLVLLRPFRKVLAEREQGTTETDSEAGDLRAEAGRLEADYDARLKAARDQATAQRAELRAQGVSEAEGLVEKAREESEKVSETLAAELQGELEKARASLKAQADEISGAIVTRLLGKGA